MTATRKYKRLRCADGVNCGECIVCAVRRRKAGSPRPQSTPTRAGLGPRSRDPGTLDRPFEPVRLRLRPEDVFRGRSSLSDD